MTIHGAGAGPAVLGRALGRARDATGIA